MQQEEKFTKKDVIMGIGGALPLFIPLELLGQGQAAIIAAIAGGVVSYIYSDEIAAFAQKRIPALQDPAAIKKWLTSRPGQALQDDEEQYSQNDQAQARDIATQEPEPGAAIAPDASIDALFQAAREAPEVTTIPRLLCNDIIRHTPQDSYQVCIGRSLTKRNNPPIWINFYQQHLKLIGASQYGKSSMAAAILYLITRTHSPSNVLIALLDMEYKTSKLFVDCPHLAAVTIGDRPVTLHAKNKQQTLEYLGHIIRVLDYRYEMSEEEVEAEPLLIVYLEEFLALKDHFKKLIDATTGEAKEQAKRDYANLVYRVSEIARRGLKVKVQLLMCAQVDYRDDDFQEALVNVTGGMSFCVRTTAAQAAGFTRSDLLKRNVEEDKKGQAVVETPDCKDLVLAPEYNLKKKLLAYEAARQAQAPARPREQRASMLAPASRDNQDQDQAPQQPERQPDEDAQAREAWRRIAQQPEQQAQQPAAAPRQEDNQRKLTHLHRQVLEHYRPGLGLRKLGELVGVGKDKAADLKSDLIKWGFLKDDGANE